MQFTLTEDQRLIQASAQDWLAAHYDFRARAAGVHRDGGSAAAWAAWSELGWLALPLPDTLGGIGGGPVEAGVLMQALGRHLAVEPVHGCVLQAARLLALAGTAAQRERWLPALAQGRLRLAFAHAEVDDALPWEPRRCSAQRRGEGWVLEGCKQAVDGAAGAACWLVSAHEPGTGRTRVLLVEPGLAGISVDAYDTLDGGRAADLRFGAVQLPADALLGAADQDTQAVLRQVLAEGIVARCWQATGAMQAALEQTARHTRQRRQFGQALADFQVVQHRLAEMAVHCTEAQAACELAAMRLAQEPSAGAALAAMAKSKVARAARFVAREAVQLHGAMGVCEELPVAAAFRFLLAFAQRDGDAARHAAWLGAELLAGGAHAHSQALGVAA